MVIEMILAAFLGCYVVSSLILFKFPMLLHKKKDVKFVCRHISHRGGAGENYENTISAFRHAVEVGTDMLELDCQLTLDGQVVVSHDSILDVRTESKGAISEYKYEELPLIREQVPIDFMPGTTFSGKSDDRRFPLLEETFQLFPNLPINIDIKTNNNELISKVSNLVKKYNREHITVWGNMKDEVTQKCYKENPNMCLLFSAQRVCLMLLQLYTGLLPFMPLKETHLEVFMPVQMMRIYSKNFGEKWWYSVIAKMANALLIRRSLFEHLSKRGIQTYLWVMNSEEDFRSAFEAGATGVMTDYPTKLRAFLDSNPQYTQDHKLS
ncbi:lysophospholipase D GDPD1-like isoform X1 [Penaeus chinensis]|uniref:lysophospholipase D GDPD1-like isoform X1 n=1 Tax=Penaeus chinensis TaxID=139456 RepID=UPI001FB600B7|nr:lysophospholipase D GDPD1-like isoform X1 [Penaeus chinensis]